MVMVVTMLGSVREIHSLRTNYLDALTHAIITVESGHNPKAKSKKGAIGLMQIRPVVWEKELRQVGLIKTKKDLYDPEMNIRAGQYILIKMIARTKNLEQALKWYSGGAKNYHKKVMKAMEPVYFDD
jgi:soluble lytic murein transglycosylase-like protein